MTGCARLRPLLTAIAALILSQPGAAACWIDDVTVLPFWTITNADPVSLEIVVGTSTTPAHLYQPTEMIINGNEFIIDLFVDGGAGASPDTWVETMQLGTLSPGDYTYTVTQNGLEGSWCTGTHTESGTFCIEHVWCNEDACRCPVFVPTYTIIDLGTLGGGTTIAYGINDAGQVCGSGGVSGSGDWHAFLWQDGVMTDLGTVPPADESWARDINNAGAIVGFSNNSAGTGGGFIWENGEMSLLVERPTAASAFAINDSRQVAGIFAAPGGEHAFLWEDGVLTDLGTLGGSLSHARDINNAGQITGRSFTGAGDRPFLWEDGVMTELPTWGGGQSEAFSINEAGQIVGYSRHITRSRTPALWENGEIVDLGALIEDPVSIANAINNKGQILFYGYLYDMTTGTGAYLEDLIAPDSGWSDLRALDINDSGQIVGSGWIDGMHLAFLMTPVPPPPPIPTLSEWSAVLMVLTFLTAATLMFGRRDPRAGVRLEHR